LEKDGADGGGGAPGATGLNADGGAAGAGGAEGAIGFGSEEAGVMRTGCAAGASAAGPFDAETGGNVFKRTVSRFTAGASPGFVGRVMRTVSFFGVSGAGRFGAGGMELEGLSSAIILRFTFCISLRGFSVNPECFGCRCRASVMQTSAHRGTFACPVFKQSATVFQ
jgi:hypothetical protein